MAGLFDALNKYDVPEVVERNPLDYAVTIKNTQPRPGLPDGYRIMVCTIDPPPQSIIDAADQQGLPLFVPAEINLLGRDPHPDKIKHAMNAKKVFPGCLISAETLLEVSEQ